MGSILPGFGLTGRVCRLVLHDSRPAGRAVRRPVMMKMLSCGPLQARRGGGRSLPAGLASCRDHGGAGRSQRLGLRLAPSAAQHPGPADAHARRVAAAGPQPPGGDSHPAEPTQRGEESALLLELKQHRKSLRFCLYSQLLHLNLKIYGFFVLLAETLRQDAD